MTDVSARPADPESRPRFRPWPAALSGIAWVVLFIAVRALAELDPLYEASPAEIGAYFAENTDKVFWSTQLLGLAALSLLWFAGCLRTRIRSAEPGHGHLSSLTMAGATVYAATLLGIAGALMAAARTPNLGQGEADQAVTALFLLGWAGLTGFLRISLAVWLAALAIASIRHHALPAWLGWPAALLAVALGVMPDATIAILITFLWAIAAAVTLTVLGRSVD
jgi:hypothetical protein